jgi:RHS repeat-associated protein
MDSQAQAASLGIRGVVLSVARSDGGTSAGRVHVTVNYAGFADAYGGNYGSRLELAALPACSRSTPAKASCRTETPVGSVNDAKTQDLGADVVLPGGAKTALVLAVLDTPSGSGGDFAAEPMSEETNDWVSGASSGAYNYAYPIQLPSVPGSLEPIVGLKYDSLSTSALNSSTNGEASSIGDGWSLSPGFIETDYAPCSTYAVDPTSQDMCAGSRTEVTMSLNGVTTPLVDGSGGWAAEADGGEKVIASGSTWEVIAPDGYQYYFGLQDLPGYTSGDTSTGSQLDVPVYQGCGEPGFCNRPWRDLLSYVVDPRGNAIAYYYTDQTNAYAELNGATADGTYTQAADLSTIAYGFRAGQAYTATPAAKVTFTTTGSRQDAPTDLACTSGAACSITAPTYWDDDELTGISTQTLEGGAYQQVDSWALNGTYPATGDATTSASLWLSSITRTGQDGATAITVPPVSFAGIPLPNRVATPADEAAGYSDLTRFYLTSVTSENGGVTAVGYSPPYSSSTMPALAANATAVYPDYWDAAGASSPVLDFFNTYAADTVTQDDTTSGDPPVVTAYTYTGPAWHFDTDTVSRSATATWNLWRGYQSVTTETGTAPDPVTETVATFLQGMSQAGPAGDTGPPVTLTTTRGQAVTDSNQFAGMQLESIVYDGAGSAQQVTDIVSAPWSSAATAVNSTLDQAAYLTGYGSTLTYTALAGGGVRESVENDTYNSSGLIASASQIPDTTDSSEDTCTTTAYAANTATGLLDLPEIVTTDTGVCNAAGQVDGTLVSQTDTFYDNGSLGAAPSAGDPTKTEDAVSGGTVPTFDVTSTTYDEYGRVLTSTDPDGRTTTTAYTPATGAEPTATRVTDPMGLVTTTTLDPARDLPLTETAPDGGQTVTTYDALGRPTADWAPGNPVSGPADKLYTYSLTDTAPMVTTVETEQPGGGYLSSETINDSLGHLRETQTETASGGTDVADTTYNSDGWKALVSSPYYTSAAPSGTLVAAAGDTVPSQTGYVYDGDGRVTRQISYADGGETWESDSTYGGDYTTLVPPAGGTSSTTFTDGRGLTTAIYQYHAGAAPSPSDPAADYDETTYTYTPAQKLATITDAAGDAWTNTYNLLGDQLTASDPDAGTTTSTYDAAGQLTSMTDARHTTASYTYDLDGRKTAEYDTTGGAAETSADEVASWTYDTLAKGQPTSETSYTAGSAYTEEVTGYNANGLPAGEETIIPAAQGALAGTYTQNFTYAPNGQLTSYTDSSAGGLSAETVTTGYNSAGQPDSLTGASSYVSNLTYTGLGNPLQYQEGTSSEPVYITDAYDSATNRLTQQNTQTGSANTSVDDLTYTYDDVGDVTSEADTPSGDSAADDVQCFQYDYLGRLVQAWAQGANGCASTPSASDEGGVAPYWESYAYNAIGDMTGETSTSPSGAVTATTDSYATPGGAQPHAVAGQSVTTPTGTNSSTYGYDASGELTSLDGPAQDEALTWNDQGQLSQVATTPAAGGVQQSSYIYDADGKLLLRSDPGTVTLLLNDEEIVLDTNDGTVTGTRYYTLGSDTVAAYTAGGSVAYLAGDQQGTDTVAVDAGTLGVARRYFDPYGDAIGTGSASWPGGQKGFVGGTADPTTDLTDLGSREYRPDTGSFISPDPNLDPDDPQDLDAYAYARGNPAAHPDPTGECADTDCARKPPNPTPSSHNRTSRHNLARDTAIAAIKAQLAAMGITNYQIFTNLQVPNARKDCMKAGLSQQACSGVGIPDIVVYVPASHASFVWEVKAGSQAALAQPEANWYVEAMNADPKMHKELGTAHLGWIIGGPYPVVNGDDVVGPLQGAIIYGRPEKSKTTQVNHPQPTPQPNAQAVSPGLAYQPGLGYVPVPTTFNWTQVAPYFVVLGLFIVTAAAALAVAAPEVVAGAAVGCAAISAVGSVTQSDLTLCA